MSIDCFEKYFFYSQKSVHFFTEGVVRGGNNSVKKSNYDPSFGDFRHNAYFSL